MTTPYPSNRLPAMQLRGNASRKRSQVLETRMQSGRVRRRRRGRRVYEEWDGLFVFSEYEYRIFQAWFDIYASFGAEYVAMELDWPSGTAAENIRFIGDYNPTKTADDLYEVSVVFERRN